MLLFDSSSTTAFHSLTAPVIDCHPTFFSLLSKHTPNTLVILYMLLSKRPCFGFCIQVITTGVFVVTHPLNTLNIPVQVF